MQEGAAAERLALDLARKGRFRHDIDQLCRCRHWHRRGRAGRWATALDRDGRKIRDTALPNIESRLRDLHKRLGEHGRLLVVEQHAIIGALAIAVAQDMGIAVRYLPDCRCGALQT